MPIQLPERIDRFEGPWRFLSNFARLPDGFTTEHYYQAAKSLYPAEISWVLAAPTPAEAKKRGRQVTLRKDWEAIKNKVMLDCLRYKFGDRVMRDQLLATGPAYLEEGNWWGDTYWGTVNGKGENWLGRLLMQVREEIRNGESTGRDLDR